MAKLFNKTGIRDLLTIFPGHVTQSVDAFTGEAAYDIILSGSYTLTGSQFVSNSIDEVAIDAPYLKVQYSNKYATTSSFPSAARYHGMFAHAHSTGKAYFSHAGRWIELVDVSSSFNLLGSLTGSFNGNFDGILSGAFSGSSFGAHYGYFSGSFAGDGSQLTGVQAVTVGGYSPYRTGSAVLNIIPNFGNNVNSGSYTTVLAGQNNVNSGSNAAILSGIGNILTGSNAAIITGNGNKVNTDYSIIGGGIDNVSNGRFDLIGNGAVNTINSQSIFSTIVNSSGSLISGMNSGSAIVGGSQNVISSSAVLGVAAFIGAGNQNCILDGSGVIVGGGTNKIINGLDGIIGAGNQNCIKDSSRASIVGGVINNITSSLRGFIGGGASNTLKGTQHSAIIGGTNNCIDSYDKSFIIGSNLTADATCHTYVNNLNIEGSLTASYVSSSVEVITNNVLTYNLTASNNISASNTITGLTGSYSHLVGNSPIEVGSTVEFQQPISASNIRALTGNLNIRSSGSADILIETQNNGEIFIRNLGQTGSIDISSRNRMLVRGNTAKDPEIPINQPFSELGFDFIGNQTFIHTASLAIGSGDLDHHAIVSGIFSSSNSHYAINWQKIGNNVQCSGFIKESGLVSQQNFQVPIYNPNAAGGSLLFVSGLGIQISGSSTPITPGGAQNRYQIEPSAVSPLGFVRIRDTDLQSMNTNDVAHFQFSYTIDPTTS